MCIFYTIYVNFLNYLIFRKLFLTKKYYSLNLELFWMLPFSGSGKIGRNNFLRSHIQRAKKDTHNLQIAALNNKIVETFLKKITISKQLHFQFLCFLFSNITEAPGKPKDSFSYFLVYLLPKSQFPTRFFSSSHIFHNQTYKACPACVVHFVHLRPYPPKNPLRKTSS